MLTTVLAEHFYKLYHIVVDISTLFLTRPHRV